jgi:UPF0755 protein
MTPHNFHSIFEKTKQSARGNPRLLIAVGIVVLLLIIFIYLLFIDVPAGYPIHSVVGVESGTGLSQISELFAERKVVRSQTLLKLAVVLIGGQRGAISGDYFLPEKLGTFGIAKKLVFGKHGLQTVKVTIPEGTNVEEMAEIFDTSLPGFNKTEFVSLAKKQEGFLFPDTYFFLSNVSSKEIISTMRNNFDKKIAPLNADITAFKQTLADVITMASYLEEEARLTETRQIVAGILWKRLLIGMPLQVDSTFQYINGKNSFNLTLDDLQIDSLYNTYKYKGLTPTPITNPGLDSIRAAITPKKTKYFYFLTDKNGNMHYAVDFDTHVMNKELYLR